MRKSLAYLWYLTRHKFFVFRAGLITGAPLWTLIIHDLSKFGRAEWGGYRDKFFAERNGLTQEEIDQIEERFRLALEHHFAVNPHHWNYWVSGSMALQMPDTYVREMVADWLGAGRAKTGQWNPTAWYLANREKMHLHPVTREQVETKLAIATMLLTGEYAEVNDLWART